MAPVKIRTVLIDDSQFIRKLIGDMIRRSDSLELIGIANDGLSGTEMVYSLRPDVVITDMVMPEYDGVFVVRELMKKQPIPIILLSSLEKSDGRIFDALNLGAFEFIDKPNGSQVVLDGEYPLVDLIHEAFRSDISILKQRQLVRQNSNAHTFSSSLNYDIICIGASTGGPGAIEQVICNLPKNLSIPVLIAQHMPHRFLETFAVRLNETCPIPVKLAQRGEVLKGNTIYIMPGEMNSKVERNGITGEVFINFTSRTYAEFNYPSIDCLFESIAAVYGKRSIGVILTGMGKDGTEGLHSINENGGFTIAQDEASSVVYGMPRAAVERGVVKQIVKLREVPGFLVSCL